MAEIAVLERTAVVPHGRRLEYFTIAWNTLEGLVAVVAGAIAGSNSLVGFGIDSLMEVTSGSVLLWRMSVDADVLRRERNERRALRVVRFCFLFLAAYIAYESAMDLWSRRAPEHSIPGIVLACVSLVVMPLLSRAKRKVGRALGSAAIWFPSLRRRESTDYRANPATNAPDGDVRKGIRLNVKLTNG
jgi:divalent metal cation (Fe/Co/Zn/Cd) transporter